MVPGKWPCLSSLPPSRHATAACTPSYHTHITRHAVRPPLHTSSSDPTPSPASTPTHAHTCVVAYLTAVLFLSFCVALYRSVRASLSSLWLADNADERALQSDANRFKPRDRYRHTPRSVSSTRVLCCAIQWITVAWCVVTWPAVRVQGRPQGLVSAPHHTHTHTTLAASTDITQHPPQEAVRNRPPPAPCSIHHPSHGPSFKPLCPLVWVISLPTRK